MNNQHETALAPSSPESEEALLGSILMNPDLMAIVEKEIRIEDFFILRNAWVFEVMLTIHHRTESIDEMAIYAEMKAFAPDRLRDMGGPAYLTQLINNTPTYAHYWTYLRVIQEASRRRKVLAMFSEGAQSVLEADREGVNRKLKEIINAWDKMYFDDNDMRQYIIHVNDLNKLPAAKWLVAGEIPEQGLCVLYGSSGVGKSFLALHYALTLAEAMPILYVASEGQYGYPGRVQAWRDHNHLMGNHLSFFMREIALSEEAQREKFQKAIEDIHPKAIFIDTLAHCLLPGDENSARDMGFFIRGALTLVKAFECSVILIHHTGVEGERLRGSTALRGAADVVIKLSGDDDIICVECDKSKDAKPFATRYMRLLPVETTEYGAVPCIVPTAVVITSKDDPLTIKQEKILRTLAETFAFGAGPAELAEAVNIPRGQIQKILSRMTKLGHVSQSGAKDPYQITEQGLRKVSPMTPRLLSDSTSDSTRKPSQQRRDSSDSTKSGVSIVNRTRGDQVESEESEGGSQEYETENPTQWGGGVGWSRRSRETNPVQPSLIEGPARKKKQLRLQRLGD